MTYALSKYQRFTDFAGNMRKKWKIPKTGSTPVGCIRETCLFMRIHFRHLAFCHAFGFEVSGSQYFSGCQTLCFLQSICSLFQYIWLIYLKENVCIQISLFCQMNSRCVPLWKHLEALEREEWKQSNVLSHGNGILIQVCFLGL